MKLAIPLDKLSCEKLLLRGRNISERGKRQRKDSGGPGRNIDVLAVVAA